MKRLIPRMLSIVRVPRKIPANTRNTRSRRAWRWDASTGCNASGADAMAERISDLRTPGNQFSILRRPPDEPQRHRDTEKEHRGKKRRGAEFRRRRAAHSPSADHPPRDTIAWTCGCQFPTSPAVWTTTTIPGRNVASPTAAVISSSTVSHAARERPPRSSRRRRRLPGVSQYRELVTTRTGWRNTAWAGSEAYELVSGLSQLQAALPGGPVPSRVDTQRGGLD